MQYFFPSLQTEVEEGYMHAYNITEKEYIQISKFRLKRGKKVE